MSDVTCQKPRMLVRISDQRSAISDPRSAMSDERSVLFCDGLL
jgi:hypothetical protein